MGKILPGISSIECPQIQKHLTLALIGPLELDRVLCGGTVSPLSAGVFGYLLVQFMHMHTLVIVEVRCWFSSLFFAVSLIRSCESSLSVLFELRKLLNVRASGFCFRSGDC